MTKNGCIKKITVLFGLTFSAWCLAPVTSTHSMEFLRGVNRVKMGPHFHMGPTTIQRRGCHDSSSPKIETRKRVEDMGFWERVSVETRYALHRVAAQEVADNCQFKINDGLLTITNQDNSYSCLIDPKNGFKQQREERYGVDNTYINERFGEIPVDKKTFELMQASRFYQENKDIVYFCFYYIHSKIFSNIIDFGPFKEISQAEITYRNEKRTYQEQEKKEGKITFIGGVNLKDLRIIEDQRGLLGEKTSFYFHPTDYTTTALWVLSNKNAFPDLGSGLLNLISSYQDVSRRGSSAHDSKEYFIGKFREVLSPIKHEEKIKLCRYWFTMFLEDLGDIERFYGELLYGTMNEKEHYPPQFIETLLLAKFLGDDFIDFDPKKSAFPALPFPDKEILKEEDTCLLYTHDRKDIYTRLDKIQVALESNYDLDRISMMVARLLRMVLTEKNNEDSIQQISSFLNKSTELRVKLKSHSNQVYEAFLCANAKISVIKRGLEDRQKRKSQQKSNSSPKIDFQKKEKDDTAFGDGYVTGRIVSGISHNNQSSGGRSTRDDHGYSGGDSGGSGSSYSGSHDFGSSGGSGSGSDE